jgi:hypothetical protein
MASQALLEISRAANALPFSCKPAAESAPRFHTMSLRRDCQLQRLVRRRCLPAAVNGSVVVSLLAASVWNERWKR